MYAWSRRKVKGGCVARVQSRVDAGHESLCCRFFVSGSAVDLTGAEQPFNRLGLQCRESAAGGEDSRTRPRIPAELAWRAPDRGSPG